MAPALLCFYHGKRNIVSFPASYLWARLSQVRNSREKYITSRPGERKGTSLWAREDLYRWKKSGESEILNKYKVVHLVLVIFMVKDGDIFLWCDANYVHSLEQSKDSWPWLWQLWSECFVIKLPLFCFFPLLL